MGMGWLSTLGRTIGKDAKQVFAWVTSTKGQTVIATGEAAAEALGAPAAVINMANYWFGKAITVEALAANAGEQDGSGPQKAAAVLQDVTPYVISVAKQNGLPIPTADNLFKANTALVSFLNALGAGATPTNQGTATTQAFQELAAKQPVAQQ